MRSPVFRQIIVLSIILMVLSILGCSSRYRLDLFLQTESFQKKVNVEQTQFIKDSRLADPLSDSKIILGNGNSAIITVSTRIKTKNELDTDIPQIFTFDNIWKSHLYLNIPQKYEIKKYELIGNSFINLLEHYELKSEEKVFLPRSGYYQIDSVTSSLMFLTIDGEFINQNNISVSLNGQFKIKIS